MKYFTVPLTGLEWTGRIFGFSSWSMSCPSELLILWSGRRCFRIGFKTLFTTESDSSKHKQTNKIKSNKIKESELTKKKINNSESKWWKHSGPLETVSNLTRSSLNQTKLPHPNNKYHFVKSSIFFETVKQSYEIEQTIACVTQKFTMSMTLKTFNMTMMTMMTVLYIWNYHQSSKNVQN